jgi:hypothetical protein
MPQLTADQLRDNILKGADAETQTLYNYKPEEQKTTVPSGPEKNAPAVDISNFDLVVSSKTQDILKGIDEEMGAQDKFNFSLLGTLENVYNGVYDNGVNSEDKEIATAWKAFKDAGVSYVENLGRAERGELSQEEVTTLNSEHNNLLSLWNTARNSLDVYYDPTAEETKQRTGENKKLYYSPVADKLVDALTFERTESEIYQGGFFANTPAYIAKHNPTMTEISATALGTILRQGGMKSAGDFIDWMWGIDPDDLKRKSEKEAIAGYNDAYSMLQETDPHTEQAAKGLAITYFDRATDMTTESGMKKKYFGGKDSEYVAHEQQLGNNIDYMLELLDKGGNNEVATNLLISYKKATMPGSKTTLSAWLTDNKKQLKQLSQNMTPVQYVQMYKHFKVADKWGAQKGGVLSNPYYFNKDLKVGQDRLTEYINIIDPYIKEQYQLRKDLHKINGVVLQKMQTERNPDHMQNTGSNYQEAVFLKFLGGKGGKIKTEKQLYAAIDDYAAQLAEKYPHLTGPEGWLDNYYNEIQSGEFMAEMDKYNHYGYTQMKKEQLRRKHFYGHEFATEQLNIKVNLSRKGTPTDAEKRFMDWYFAPEGVTTNDYGDFANGQVWMHSSGESRESYNNLVREFKIEFGKQSVDEVYKHTVMKDSFGKRGAHSIEYRRVNRNDQNAVKSKHFNHIVDIAKQSFKKDALAGKVYIKDGALNHVDRPDMYSDKNNSEKLDLLNNFFKNDKTAEYKVSYINQTADNNKIAYMISEYDKKGNFKNNITLFMDKSYAKENKEIFASSVYSDISDERYRMTGSYDLSALNDSSVATNLRFETENGGMWLMGTSKMKDSYDEPLRIFMGADSHTSIDEAIEKVRFNFAEYKKDIAK